MTRRDRAAELRTIMSEEGDAIRSNAQALTALSQYAVDSLPRYEQLREEARSIKEDAIDQLPALIEQVESAVDANGGTVHLAEDASEANQIIREVIRGRDAATVAKSKSMTTEELEVNHALERAGIDVWETDLGEFIVQEADEAPSHLVGPAMHKSAESIADLFNERFDPANPLEAEPNKLTEFAREQVKRRIHEADVGITGANFVAAETGTIALVTNEGNARLTTALTDTHIAVAGVEKLLPTVADLQPFLELIARAGVGQDLTSYVSLFTPPVETPTVAIQEEEPTEPDEREFHLVLVDNGRFEMREDDDLVEALYCIRCGACANFCPTFQSVGGHAFGGKTYTGGIAGAWEAGVHGHEHAEDVADLCTGCSRCVPRCPVKIDIPWLNAVVRDQVNQPTAGSPLDQLLEALPPELETSSPRSLALAHLDSLAEAASQAPDLANWAVQSETGKWALETVLNIDSRHPLPTFADERFTEWWGRQEPLPDPDIEVVLFPDLFTEFFRPERGKSAVRVLQTLGVGIQVPDPADTGRIALSEGMQAQARKRARGLLSALEPHLEGGRPIVFLEPSDLAMVQREYSRLVPGPDQETLAAASRWVMALVAERLDGNETAHEELPTPPEESITIHPHCQGRTIGTVSLTASALEEAGWRVEITDTECCGMAGSFGYKSEYAEVADDVADQLRSEIGTEQRVGVEGGSCAHVIDGFDTAVSHPIRLLDPES
ncbi:MAG: LUD domain-containing protein [Halanaeroarchaeum sp.]